MTHDKIIKLILAEVDRAEKKHTRWPDDIIHACGIVVEEAGESIQAALDYTYLDGDFEHIREELIQTGATVIRALKNLREK